MYVDSCVHRLVYIDSYVCVDSCVLTHVDIDSCVCRLMCVDSCVCRLMCVDSCVCRLICTLAHVYVDSCVCRLVCVLTHFYGAVLLGFVLLWPIISRLFPHLTCPQALPICVFLLRKILAQTHWRFDHTYYGLHPPFVTLEEPSFTGAAGEDPLT